MAHIINELKFGSREGSSRGAGGVNDTRTFIVTLDMADAEFTENRYPDPRGIVEIYKVPYGTASPWNQLAQATQYTLGERMGNKTWKVQVGYTTGGVPTPAMEVAFDRWMVSIRGAATTQQIIEEPIEAIESWNINEGPLAREGRLIGTPHFAKGFSEADPTAPEGEYYYATLWRYKPDNTIEKYDQPLYRTGLRTPRPYTADVPALTYTQTRLFANFALEQVGYIVRYYKRVNLFKYLGAQPGHLKFMDIALDEVAHAIGTPATTPQLEYGIAYRISLVFLFSAKAFTPWNLVATIKDERGNEAPIIDSDGKKVVDENHVIAGVDFNTLTRSLGGVRISPGIRPRR